MNKLNNWTSEQQRKRGRLKRSFMAIVKENMQRAGLTQEAWGRSSSVVAPKEASERRCKRFSPFIYINFPIQQACRLHITLYTADS